MSQDDDLRIARVLFAGVSKIKYCQCPGSKEGIINYDPFAHEVGCKYRKKIVTGEYTVDISILTDKIKDGYALGVVSDN